jgi:hypothetical protein
MLRRITPRTRALTLLLTGCGGELVVPGDSTSSSSSTGDPICEPSTLAFETGDPDGHPDPFGAKAAGQARAGRIVAADVVQPAHGRQRVEAGDFVLVNDRVAVVIEDRGVSDGYGRFGGEIVALDRVGDDGKPVGGSYFGETLQATSLYQIEPTSVTVMNDGSDGNAAVLRVTGPLTGIPFLIETFAALFPAQYEGLQAVTDYSLEPGQQRLKISFGIANDTEYAIDTGLKSEGSVDILGFFQGSFNDLFTPATGYAGPSGATPFVGFDNEEIPFAYLGPEGSALEFGGINISGFTVYNGAGQNIEPCTQLIEAQREIVIGLRGEGIDGLRRVLREEYGEAPWRSITGTVTDSLGAPVGGAFVHVLGADDSYTNRVLTDDDGTFTLEAPDEDVVLIPQKRGYRLSEGEVVAAGESTTTLAFEPNGFLEVTATEAGSAAALPVRIQVIPQEALPATPERFGVLDEVNGRLWQQFEPDGAVTLPVPPGTHRVVVSHGYEYEIHDVTVDVAAGATVPIVASLLRSVDTTGAMSADFHIHSQYSADSNDPIDYKIRGTLADGVELPATSEHEWVNPWQPRVEAMGMESWMFAVTSEELTTFTWGHFGVVPIQQRPERVNNGAIDWIGKTAEQMFAEIDELPEQPAIIINHPSGDGAFQAYFNAVKLDRATGTSDSPLWSENFDAIEVFNDSTFDSNRDRSVADWFALLASGKTYWAVGSSDTHRLRTSPAGYPRTYLFLGYDDPLLASESDVRDAIKGGTMTIGGGLFMSVEGPNGSSPGDVETKTASADFTVTVRCPSWVGADTLEVIVNGETVSEEPLLPVGAGPGKTFVNSVSVALPPGPRAFVLFHARGTGDLSPVTPGKAPFAVSNPILFAE